MIAPEPPTNPARALEERALHVEMEDLDMLLAAVTHRLRRIVASPGVVAGASAGMAADVLDCADALVQLEASLRLEITRRRQLEHELFDARTNLARLRAGLPAGTPLLPPLDGSGHR